MSFRRTISWTAATRDMRNDRVQLPAGFLSARGLIECFVKTRRPLVVAGKFDRAAIMAHAAAAAKQHQARTGSTWAAAMSVSLKAAWQVAKAAHRAAAH
ncbi:hypothetical protein ASF41_21680 [Methylobacterium sp. Leaf111]|uniref:hypothetical protein n=1 Tax=Methylobacterium sp. Leaf111 TaxID=1736257 RepID=UPI0006FD2C16|nr:hypothetical protein [Methylobacterium sp. Leaf111]KQP67680.1 hypothetical protein ASF41_21680 [Methylobacterium sp. Leaf111]